MQPNRKEDNNAATTLKKVMRIHQLQLVSLILAVVLVATLFWFLRDSPEGDNSSPPAAKEVSGEETPPIKIELPTEAEQTEISPDEEALLDYFRRTQASTVTPYGPVRTDTAFVRDDKVFYQTLDGSWWSVTAEKRDVDYYYVDVQPVKVAGG